MQYTICAGLLVPAMMISLRKGTGNFQFHFGPQTKKDTWLVHVLTFETNPVHLSLA